MITLLAIAMAAGHMPTSYTCLMRPPRIDAQNIKHSPMVKSLVVDANKRTASVLLKSGSVLRVTNGGCEHAYSTVRLLVVGPQPSISEVGPWAAQARLASDVGFDAVEAKLFDRWLQTAKFVVHGNDGLSAQGVTAGDVQYSVDITRFGEAIGTAVTVSYTYD